jgi:formylglycine-generating enzyme required for sulfatase activity
VVGVTWDQARRFAEWAGARLPSEAEWEYAARAGTSEPYLLGSSEADLDRVAWYSNNAGGRLHPVGEKAANGWGPHDALGNVWEWVEDDWHSSYEGARTDGSAWVETPRGDGRAVRGGWMGHQTCAWRPATGTAFPSTVSTASVFGVPRTRNSAWPPY